MSAASDEDPADGVTSSPKRNRAKVQKTKGSHGGARANAGRKPSTSKLHKWCAATSLPHFLHHFTSKIVHSDTTFLGLGLWL